MLREADAVWTDGIYGGCGSVSAPSGVLNRTKYVFWIGGNCWLDQSWRAARGCNCCIRIRHSGAKDR